MFLVKNSVVCSLRKALELSSKPTTSLGFSPRPRVLRRLISTSLPMSSPPSASDVPRPFNPSITSVRLKDEGEPFVCDEEPHMLSPELGYGYFPLILGQRLQDGRLEIVRKLGWGGYSSVWLARTVENSTTRYVAVKVLTVNGTAGEVNGALGELEALRRIASRNPDAPGYQHCIHLHESFVAKSHHGPHICMVTDFLAWDITQFRHSQPNGVLSVPFTKRIVKQTLLALDYLHRECGIIHTDVKPENILIRGDQSDAAITEYVNECPSLTYEPRIEADLTPDPIITVVSQPLPNIGLKPDASNLTICLSDFGQSTPVEKHLVDGVQPVLLRAPEVILCHPWSASIDIWSLGCLVFEFLVGATLFQLHETSSVRLEDVHLERIIELLGPIPLNFLAACTNRDDFFDENGSLLRINKYFPRTLEECLRNYNRVDETDIPGAAAFIRRCLTIDPAQRPSAVELLDDEWLRNT